MLMMIGLTLISSCAKDEAIAPMVPTPVGANQQVIPNQTAVGALINASGQPTGCSVAFIGERFALTAARCIGEANPSLYSVSIDSPIGPSSPRLGLATIVVHPLWNNTELNQSRSHIEAVRRGQPGYYASTASYDLAVITLSLPKADQTYLDPLPSSASFDALETLYYANAELGSSRSGSRLTISERTPTTLTSLEYSLLASTIGGGAGMVTLDSGRGALVGIASGGDGQGTVFTLVGAHSLFIGDVIRDEYSASNDPNRYRITVNGPQVTEPEPIEQNGFDCSMMSDGFCDRNCRRGEGDIDCQEVVVEETGSEFGSPCTLGSDCRSRLCLGINPTRYVCSDFCNPYDPTPCPRGFSCVMDTEGDTVCGPTPEITNQSGNDPAELRLFGANCENDAQCTTGNCITYQGQKWCSERCSNNDDCPISYICGSLSRGRACIPPPRSN